jgi:hypothetical protein
MKQVAIRVHHEQITSPTWIRTKKKNKRTSIKRNHTIISTSFIWTLLGYSSCKNYIVSKTIHSLEALIIETYSQAQKKTEILKLSSCASSHNATGGHQSVNSNHSHVHIIYINILQIFNLMKSVSKYMCIELLLTMK